MAEPNLPADPSAPADFLGLAGKTYLVMGVANKKSVAFRIAKTIEAAGGQVIYSVRSESRKESLAKLLKDRQVIVCDVENFHGFAAVFMAS